MFLAGVLPAHVRPVLEVLTEDDDSELAAALRRVVRLELASEVAAVWDAVVCRNTV